MKHTFFMFMVGLADIVDAIKNYVTGAPVNGIGVLLFVVVFLYFLELAREKVKQHYDKQIEELKNEDVLE